MQGIRASNADPDTDRAAFIAWHHEGTIAKACQKLKRDGIVSTRGKPLSPDGVRKAAVRYMMNHYPEAKISYKEAYDRFGYVVDDIQIERLLIRMAFGTFRNPARIKHWLLEHDLMDKHKLFIESLIAI